MSRRSSFDVMQARIDWQSSEIERLRKELKDSRSAIVRRVDNSRNYAWRNNEVSYWVIWNHWRDYFLDVFPHTENRASWQAFTRWLTRANFHLIPVLYETTAEHTTIRMRCSNLIFQSGIINIWAIEFPLPNDVIPPVLRAICTGLRVNRRSWIRGFRDFRHQLLVASAFPDNRSEEDRESHLPIVFI